MQHPLGTPHHDWGLGTGKGTNNKNAMLVALLSGVAKATSLSSGTLQCILEKHDGQQRVGNATFKLGPIDFFLFLEEVLLGKAVLSEQDVLAPIITHGELVVLPPPVAPGGFVRVNVLVTELFVLPIELDGRADAHGRVVSHGLLIAPDRNRVKANALAAAAAGGALGARVAGSAFGSKWLGRRRKRWKTFPVLSLGALDEPGFGETIGLENSVLGGGRRWLLDCRSRSFGGGRKIAAGVVAGVSAGRRRVGGVSEIGVVVSPPK